MHQITVRVPDNVMAEIEAIQSEEGGSQSEATRILCQRGLDYEEMQTEMEELQTECERLQRELQATNRRVGEHQELVAWASQEKSLQERREQRELEREQAGVLTRTKWFFMGRDIDSEE